MLVLMISYSLISNQSCSKITYCEEDDIEIAKLCLSTALEVLINRQTLHIKIVFLGCYLSTRGIRVCKSTYMVIYIENEVLTYLHPQVYILNGRKLHFIQSRLSSLCHLSIGQMLVGLN